MLQHWTLFRLQISDFRTGLSYYDANIKQDKMISCSFKKRMKQIGPQVKKLSRNHFVYVHDRRRSYVRIYSDVCRNLKVNKPNRTGIFHFLSSLLTNFDDFFFNHILILKGLQISMVEHALGRVGGPRATQTWLTH